VEGREGGREGGRRLVMKHEGWVHEDMIDDAAQPTASFSVRRGVEESIESHTHTYTL